MIIDSPAWASDRGMVRAALPVSRRVADVWAEFCDWGHSTFCARSQVIAPGVLCLAGGLMMPSSPLDGWSSYPIVLRLADVTLGVAACIAVVARRRYPAQVALFAALASALSITGAITNLYTIGYVASRCRIQVTLALAGLSAAALLPYAYVYRRTLPPTASTLFVSLVMLVTSVLVGLLIQSRRQSEELLRLRAVRSVQEEQARIRAARRAERCAMAREMHDTLTHRLTLLSIHAGALYSRPTITPEELSYAAWVIRDSAHQGLVELREVLSVLRNMDSHAPSTLPADRLEVLVDDSRRAGASIDVRLEVAVESLPPDLAYAIYRVTQEGLSNARKHAPGAAVEIRVDGARGEGLRLRVRNGPGTGDLEEDAIPGSGTGLLGLVERTALLGGRLTYGCEPGGGFVVCAELPW